MQADLESILWKFGSDRAICLWEEAICAKVYRQTDEHTHIDTTENNITLVARMEKFKL